MDAEGRNAVPAQPSVRLAGLRPRHVALCAFVTTLLACVPVIVIFNGAPRYAADAGLRLASELIEIFVVDQSVTDDPRENIFDVQVRILPCNEDCFS